MPTSDNLEKLKSELLAAQATILPQIEGLEDLDRLNILQPSKSKVQATHARFKKRLENINITLAALDVLHADDFPNMPNVTVTQEVYDDLLDQTVTIAAAFAKFSREQAVDLGVVIGSPEPKP